MIEASRSVSSVYVHVIDDVVAKVRDEFANTGTPEDVLDALQRIWESKMIQCGAISPTDRPVRPVLVAPVHDLNVPYEGPYDGPYETPTAEMLFPPTPQQTPSQTPFVGTSQTPVPGTVRTPLPGIVEQSMYNINIPPGPSNMRNGVEVKHGRLNPYMQPLSPWMNQRPLGVDVNVAYVEGGHDEADGGTSREPMTQDFFTVSSGKRKRDEPTGHIPQLDGSTDMKKFDIPEANTATDITEGPRSSPLLLPQQDGVNDEYNFYHFQGVANEDYNAPPVENVEVRADAMLGTLYDGTSQPTKTELLDDDEPPLNEADDDEDDLDELEQGGEEPNTHHLVLAQFDKVTRTKSRWKCTLKSGIMHYNNRDVLFNKANGEFEF